MRKHLLLLILLASYLGFGYYLTFTWERNARFLPDIPEITLKFEGREQAWKPEPVDISHVVFEKQGQRLYQFHESGKYGCILRYKVFTKDPAKPLAYVSRTERDEYGKLKTYRPHGLCVFIDTQHPDWKFAWADGLYTEHWKPDGSIQCVSSVDGDSISVDTWGDSAKDCVSIEVRPQDGYYSTGEPMDAIPLHSVEIDFYIHPKVVKKHAGQ